jgi:hypothetical protein
MTTRADLLRSLRESERRLIAVFGEPTFDRWVDIEGHRAIVAVRKGLTQLNRQSRALREAATRLRALSEGRR